MHANDLNSDIGLKRSVGYVPEPVLLSSIFTLSFPKTSLNVISLPYRSNKRTSPNEIVARPQAERWKKCGSTPGRGKNFLSPKFGGHPSLLFSGLRLLLLLFSSLIHYSPLWNMASSTIFLHSRRLLTIVYLCLIRIVRGSCKIFPESLYF